MRRSKTDKTNKENESNKEFKFKYEKLKIHMIYWIFMLAILSIGLFSTRAHGSESLSSEIAFGATLSGIILSVIAIIMTIVGESKSESAKDKLVNLSSDLEEIAENIKESTKKLEDISIMKENLSEIKENLSSISGRFDLSEFDTSKNQDKEVPIEYYEKIYDDYISRVDERTNKYVIVICYHIILCKKRDKETDFEKIISILEETEKEYDDEWFGMTFGSAVLFMPAMSRDSVNNKFSKRIEEDIVKNYNKIKLLIDKI